jgi:hypothetical protein
MLDFDDVFALLNGDSGLLSEVLNNHQALVRVHFAIELSAPVTAKISLPSSLALMAIPGNWSHQTEPRA